MGLPEKSVLLELFLFLTPGIIIVYLLGLVRIGPRLEYRFLLLHYVVASTFFYALTFPFFNWEGGWMPPTWLYNLLYYLVVPSLLGLGLAYVSKFSIDEGVWKFLRLEANVPIDDAWDYMFGKELGDGKWIIVTLKTGEVIYGFIGGASLAGNSPLRRDIFIERIFTLDDQTGDWLAVEPHRSLYVTEREVRFLELIDV